MCTESGGDAVGYVGGVESAVFFVSRVGRGSGGGGGDGAIASVSGEREEEREDEEERGVEGRNEHLEVTKVLQQYANMNMYSYPVVV